jgi:hypothetical protein
MTERATRWPWWRDYTWPRICGQEIRPFETFSVFPSPREDHVLALFRAYLDDSGAPTGGHKFLTVAGYAAEVSGWKDFDRRWAEALQGAGVPYLHMKEFGKVDSGIYAVLKADKNKEAEFLMSLRDIIYDTVDCGVQATVVLADLRAFNKEHRLRLDPYALGIYSCVLELMRKYAFSNAEAVVDAFDNVHLRCGLALDYVKSDSEAPATFAPVAVVPIQSPWSFKTVLPLQAADLIAWEMRKFCEDHSDWDFSKDDRSSMRAVDKSYKQFAEAYRERHGRPPRVRKSLWALREDSVLAPQGPFLDRQRLEMLHARHPDGWR